MANKVKQEVSNYNKAEEHKSELNVKKRQKEKTERNLREIINSNINSN